MANKMLQKKKKNLNFFMRSVKNMDLSRFWQDSMLLDERISVRLIHRVGDDFLIVEIAVQRQDHVALVKDRSKVGSEDRLFSERAGWKTQIFYFTTKISALQRGKHSAHGPSSRRWHFVSRYCWSDVCTRHKPLIAHSSGRGPVELYSRLLLLFNFLVLCHL